MELEILGKSPIETPTPAQITAAVEAAYSGAAEGIILWSDGRAGLLQMAGMTVEYGPGPNGGMMRADIVSLDVCTRLFLDYAAGGTEWQHAVTWVPQAAPARPPAVTGAPNAAQPQPPASAVPGAAAAPARKLSGKRILLAALLGVMLACGLCYFSVAFFTRQEPPQSGRLMAELAFTVVWLALGGIAWAVFHIDRVWPTALLATLLVLSLPLIVGQLWLASFALGWASWAFFSALLADGLALFLVIRQLRLALEFDRESVEAPGQHLQLSLQLDSSLEGGVSYIPVLTFDYLDNRAASAPVALRQKASYAAALAQNRLRVTVRYLPRKPELRKVRVDVLPVN